MDPAVGIIELDSIAQGVVTGDAMVKAAPVGSIYAGTVHPGRYLVLVSGDTASVEVALEVGRDVGGTAVLDSIFLPDIHPDVTAAIVATDAVSTMATASPSTGAATADVVMAATTAG